MIQSGLRSDGWQSSSIQTVRATSAPYRDGLYLGKLAAARGGESQISTGRWTAEADRASFKGDFSRATTPAWCSAPPREVRIRSTDSAWPSSPAVFVC